MARLLRSLGLSAVLLAGGCVQTIPAVTAPPSPPPLTQGEDPLAPGDMLEILFTRTNAAERGPYRLKIGDVVSVDVADRPELSSPQLRILSDGRVSMRNVGAVPLAGRSIEEASGAIASALERRGFRGPAVVVSVDSANHRLEQFMRTAAPEPQGSRIQLRVLADTPLSLPLIPSLRVQGRSLSEVRRDITEGYRREFGGQLDVAVNLRERADRMVFVSGEVQRPGVVPLQQNSNAAAVIAAAGGFAESAKLSQILVVRFRPDGGFWHWTIDLSDLQQGEAGSLGIPLRNRDVIYVSRTPVGDVNRFVEIYIRRNIPIPLGFGFSIIP